MSNTPSTERSLAGAAWNLVTVVRNATANLLFLLLVGLLLVVIFAEESASVPDGSVLVLDPSGTIVEESQLADPLFQLFNGPGGNVSETLLRDLLGAIDGAAADARISHMILDLRKLRGGSLANLLEIGDALSRFRESGKSVYAHATDYSQSQYLLAAHATEVYLDDGGMNPLGPVFLTGMGVYPLYYEKALAELKVNYHIFRAGVFKSAVEPYLRDSMSPETASETRAWLDVVWGEYLDRIVAQRGLERADLEAYSEDYDTLVEATDDLNQIAVDAGLVDRILTHPEWSDHLEVIAGGALGSHNSIHLKRYLVAIERDKVLAIDADPSVAVIVAKGIIYDGHRPPGSIGAETVSEMIKLAGSDPSVRALVLRVDSPGGSASAAEKIRSQLEALQAQGKPVVTSMAGSAASGGYWVAATSDKIYAEPSTITGSIGTFIMLPTFEGTLGWLGVSSGGVGTTPLADAMDPFRPLNPVVERTLQKSVDLTYRRFTSLVARGRSIPHANIAHVAEGRVFAGRTAAELGLVDTLGYLEDAAAEAARLAGIEDYTLRFLKPDLSPMEQLIRELGRVQLLVGDALLARTGQWRGPGVASRVAREFRDAARMAEARGLFSQCLVCTVTW